MAMAIISTAELVVVIVSAKTIASMSMGKKHKSDNNDKKFVAN